MIKTEKLMSLSNVKVVAEHKKTSVLLLQRVPFSYMVHLFVLVGIMRLNIFRIHFLIAVSF